MTSETAIEIINIICDKIGIVYDKAIGLVPYIARYNIARCLTWIIPAAITVVICALLIYSSKKKAAEYNDLHKNDHRETTRSWFDYFEGMVGVSGLFIAGPVLTVFVGYLIIWLVAPEISALKWALSLIGGC